MIKTKPMDVEMQNCRTEKHVRKLGSVDKNIGRSRMFIANKEVENLTSSWKGTGRSLCWNTAILQRRLMESPALKALGKTVKDELYHVVVDFIVPSHHLRQ